MTHACHRRAPVLPPAPPLVALQIALTALLEERNVTEEGPNTWRGGAKVTMSERHGGAKIVATESYSYSEACPGSRPQGHFDIQSAVHTFELEHADDGSSSGDLVRWAAEQAWPVVEIAPDARRSDPGAQRASAVEKLFRRTLVPEPSRRGGSRLPQRRALARVAPLSVLLAIKQSHSVFPVAWHKHVTDLHTLRAAVAKLPTAVVGGGGGGGSSSLKEPTAVDLEAFVTKRQAEAQARYGEHRLHMNVSNEEFFKVHYLRELVPRSVLRAGLCEGAAIYTHDELHDLVAYSKGKPLFATMKTDQTKAALDRALFDAADLPTQLRLVREETMAIAAERVVVPALLRGTVPSADYAYRCALSMVLTTLSKGWFRRFGIEHYPVLCTCDVDFVALIQADGRIRSSSEIRAARGEFPDLAALEKKKISRKEKGRGRSERLVEQAMVAGEASRRFGVGDVVAQGGCR